MACVVELAAQEGRQGKSRPCPPRKSPARPSDAQVSSAAPMAVPASWGAAYTWIASKGPSRSEPAVGNTVQRDSAAVDQVGLAGRLLQPARQRQQGILGSLLQRGRDVGEAGVRRRFVRLTPSSKQRFQTGHVAGAETGQIEIDHKRRLPGSRRRFAPVADVKQTIHGRGEALRVARTPQAP